MRILHVIESMQMGGAGDIDNKSIRWIRGNDRRVALQRPQGEAFERGGVRGRVGIPDDEPRHQSLGLGGRHADAQASALRGRIGC